MSLLETPYAVACPVHGKTYLTEEQYVEQLSRPDDRWMCPICGAVSHFDDYHLEEWVDRMGAEAV